MNYYRRYPGDYARDTGHLSLAEHGAYTLLLDAYYSTGRPLPSSDSQLFKICRANTRFERSAVRSVVEQFWRATEQGLVNDRAEKEIADQQPRIDAARQNGKQGGRPAGTQRKPNGLADRNPAKSSPAPAPAFPPDRDPDPPDGVVDGSAPVDAVASIGSGGKSGSGAISGSAPESRDSRRRRGNGAATNGSGQAPTRATWLAYAAAYAERYGAEPVRNARINGQLAQLIRRIPREEAPEVACWYVGSGHARYVAAGHPVGMLLADAEALRTEWATGRRRSASQARQVDATQGRGDQARRLIERYEREDRDGKG